MNRIETWKPESLAVYSADYVGGIVVRGQQVEPHIGRRDQTIMIHDNLDDPRTAITIDGRAVDRWELLRWFSTTKGVRLRIEADDRRYGLIVRADFTAGAG